jgi:O-antigen/teichoic acid export membrane protein
MTATQDRTRSTTERHAVARPPSPSVRRRDGPEDGSPRLTATRRLAAEQLGVAGGQLAAGVGNLIFSLIAARVLDPGGFADLAGFLALYLLIHVPAASLSAGSAMAPEGSAALRRRVLLGGCAVGGALAVLSVPLAALLHMPVVMFLAAAAAAPTAGLIALERGRLYGLGRHRRAVASLLAEPAVRLFIGVALAAIAGPVGGALAVLAAGWAALLVAQLPGREVVPAQAPRPTAGATRAGATVVAFLLLAVVQNQDVLLANAVLPNPEAGRFAVLSTLGGVAAFASTTVPLMLLPRTGRDALRAALLVAGALGLGALAVVAISPHALVSAVFGARYASVGAIAVPYVLAMGLLGVGRVFVAHLCTVGRNREVVGLLGLAALMQFVLIVATGHDAGGVATATLAATAALTAGAAALTFMGEGVVALRGAPAGAETTPSPRSAALTERREALTERLRALVHREDFLLVAGITLFGGFLRLIATRGIWLDEATSIHQAQMSIPGLLHDLKVNDVHPPLHHLVLWVTVRLLGTGELAVRVPSLIAATALIPVLYLAGKDVYDRRAGIAAAGLCAVAPFPIWYAQEARMYALFMLFAALAAWAQVRILRDGRARDWLFYTLAATALTYTQYFGTLFILVQQVAFVVALWRVRGDRELLRSRGLAWAGWTLLFLLLVLPLMGFAQAQFSANEAAGKGFEQVPSQAGSAVASSAGAKPGAYAALTNVVWAIFGYHSNQTMTALAALWPLLLLLALGTLGRGRSWQTLLLAVCAAIPAVALFALGQVKPFVFEVRYFVGGVPVLLLLIGRGLTSWTVRPSATIAVCAAAAAALGIGEADQQLNGSNPRVYDFKGAMAQVEQDARPGDVLLYNPQYLDNTIQYYRRNDGLQARPLGGKLPRIRKGQRVFLLASFLDKPQFRTSTQAAVKQFERRYKLVRVGKRPQIRTWEFTR